MAEEVDLLAVLNSKSCKGCTKCCEGYLKADIKGHRMDLGMPCPFVIKDVGCKEYDTRPVDPCVGFECEWRRNPYFEEWLSPKVSGVLFTRQVLRPQNIVYLRITAAGSAPTPEVLSWALKYADNNKVNLMWSEGAVVRSVGSVEFCSEASKVFP